MASQGVTANSRLAEMQMKFQKKQMLEREQKKLALTTEDIHQPSKSTMSNGKVRQMFDDRRRGVGIDRSHPLRPIMSTTTTTSTIVTTKTSTQQTPTNRRPVGGTNVTRRPVITNSTLMKNATSTTRSRVNLNNTVRNGNINVFNNNLDELDNIDNETFPKEFSSLSLNNTHVMGSQVTSDRNFDNNSNEECSVLGGTIVIAKRTSPKTTTNSIKLNPVITKKSPIPTTNTSKTTSRTPSSSSTVSAISKTTTTNTIKSPLQKVATPLSTTKISKAAGNKSSNTKPATFVLSVKPPPRISAPPPGMASCQYCQRHFNKDRLAKHEEVCGKMSSKKRKIFDASKHRVKGTEAEKYVRKGRVSNSSAPKTVASVIKVTTQVATSSGEKKSDWRKKHEEFIAAIREAKKVQAYLAKGGKLSDLPPPPPSENPDYIQCPHCSRRFNQSAAERHIPKCANMQHNKPKAIKKRV